MRTTILVFLALVGCPKRTVHVPGGAVTLPAALAPTLPSDPAVQAVVVPNGPYGSLVMACTDVSGPAGNACVVPDACTEDGCPEIPALLVGTQNLAEGVVSIPMSQGTIAWDRGDGCENVVTTTDGTEVRAWEPGRAITPIPTESAAAYLPEGATVTSILAVDLEGDGVDEWIVEGEIESVPLVGLVRDGSWTTILEDVRPEVGEDATEQERFDAQLGAYHGELIGLTDLNLDGRLELVVSGEGYEFWGYEVGTVESSGWSSLGQAGCAH